MASVLTTQDEPSEWKGGPTNTLLCADVGRGQAVPKRRNAAAALFRALRKYPLTRALRYLDLLTASDLGVHTSDAAKIRSRSGVAYQEIYGGGDMTVCIFLMRKGARIPAHDHPGMHVFGRLLFGSMRVKSWDLIDEDPGELKDAPLEAYYYGAQVLGPHPCTYGLGPEEMMLEVLKRHVLRATLLLFLQEGNIHEIEAVEDCAFFDILTPPYNPRGGRDCTYFDVNLLGTSTTLTPRCRPDFGMETQEYVGPPF
eukprot:symbB.v1.2.011315.t1/scaffold755.1/size165019/13